jgi:glycosyltransferase involved in cell wall biosynthesis
MPLEDRETRMSEGTHESVPKVTPGGAVRVAVLWRRMTGYLNACLRSLDATGRVHLTVACQGPSDDAPYDEDDFSWLADRYQWKDRPESSSLKSLLGNQRIDAVLVCGWDIPAYRAILRDMGRKGTTRILCFDNQWHATAKQWLGRLTWRGYLRPFFDLAFVPGDRQVQFARMLGFRREHIMRALYCADTSAFTVPPEHMGERDRTFLFVGRLVPEKGIPALVEAYRDYRSRVDKPWPLLIAGTGPERHLFDGLPGVQMLGFLQPSEVPAVMWRATAAICPSLFEPWGVVIHEATAAGLVVLCSEAAGAGVHLVQDGFNGFVVPIGDALDLARAMTVVTKASDERLQAMSRASVLLSEQLSPERWAQYVLEMLAWKK